jgi:hypothetical protein
MADSISRAVTSEGDAAMKLDLPKIKRLKPDPYSAGRLAYERGEPFDPDFGLRFAGWGTISAQCLYENGRLSAAGLAALLPFENRKSRR